MTKLSQLSVLGLTFSLLLGMPHSAYSLIIAGDDGLDHSVAPPDDPGWNSVGEMPNGHLVTHVGDGWFILSRHTSISSGQVTFPSGQSYSITPDTLTHIGDYTADISMFHLDDFPSNIPAIPIINNSVASGQNAIVIGKGYGGGDLKHWDTNGNPIYSPVYGGSSGYIIEVTRNRLWGTNIIIDAGKDRLTIKFDGGMDGECIGVNKDSSSPIFIKNDAVWKLAGIAYNIGGGRNPGDKVEFGRQLTYFKNLHYYYDSIMSIIYPEWIPSSPATAPPVILVDLPTEISVIEWNIPPTTVSVTAQGADYYKLQKENDSLWEDLISSGSPTIDIPESNEYSLLHNTKYRIIASNPLGSATSATVHVNVLEAGLPLYVSKTASTPTYPFTSWNTAASSIQQVIDMCGEEFVYDIFIDMGTYEENLLIDDKDIRLQSKKPNNRNTVINTIIDGGLNAPVITLNGNISENASISGLTIQNGSGVEITAGHEGGGIHCDGNIYAKLSNCLITDNLSTRNGGGIHNLSGTIRNNIIQRNSAGTSEELGMGGGLSLCSGNIYNNIIINNTAGHLGGGLNRCNGEVYNNTIVNNNVLSIDAAGLPFTLGLGGGINAEAGTVRNNILWANTVPGNTDPNNSQLSVFSGSITAENNCLQAYGASGNGNIVADPLFENMEANELTLQQHSPCIDTGIEISTLISDFDGVARPLDGNKDQVIKIDIGAYEHAHLTADTDQDGMSDVDEIIAGTNPTSDLDIFQLTDINRNTSAIEVALTWSTIPGNSYDVEMTQDIQSGNWSSIPNAENLIATDSTYNLTLVGQSNPTAIYRVKVNDTVISENSIGYAHISSAPLAENDALCLSSFSNGEANGSINIQDAIHDLSRCNSDVAGSNHEGADKIHLWTGNGYDSYALFQPANGDPYWALTSEWGWQFDGLPVNPADVPLFRGEGLWYEVALGELSDVIITGNIYKDDSFQITLQDGWNFISYPFSSSIELDNLVVANGQADVAGSNHEGADKIHLWTGNGYESYALFQPASGDPYWALTTEWGWQFEGLEVTPATETINLGQGFWYESVNGSKTIELNQNYTW